MIPRSLPIVAQGDPSVAAVATLTVNPSKLELTTPTGTWLAGEYRRVESLRSLDVTDAATLTDEQVAAVVARCYGYFQANPHRPAFAALEELLGAVGAGSYYDGTACHLHLVQWATNPVWHGLPPAVREQLVAADADFLRWQLRSSGVRRVLVNGGNALEWLVRAGLVAAFETEEVEYRNAKGNLRTMTLSSAEVDGVRWQGWPTPVEDTLSPDGQAARSEWLRA
ncbi:hypothetical protein [Rhodococcus sp. X156]|uniref:hypothetical protein n=1 Tax=Rhodococcus sp. X156 TaxID=2499145 RepID=UPI000FD7667F|nr:hypothetical protein [Rhodococcus sp. X156]